MIHAIKWAGPVPYHVVWFPETHDLDTVARLRAPVTVIRQASAAFMQHLPLPVIRRTRFCTAVTDLTRSEDQLLADMHKTCRASVRRAMKVPHTFEVLPPGQALEARRLINDFNRQLYGRPVSAANWQLTDRHGFVTQLRVDGHVIAVNTYLLDGLSRARGLYAATIPREGGAMPARTIAELNRLLTWYDMQYVRDLGVRIYDAGGLFDDPDHPSAGVDQFKLSFGFTRQYEYHALTSPYLPARRGLNRVEQRP